jgi:hypothetical protein
MIDTRSSSRKFPSVSQFHHLDTTVFSQTRVEHRADALDNVRRVPAAVDHEGQLGREIVDELRFVEAYRCGHSENKATWYTTPQWRVPGGGGGDNDSVIWGSHGEQGGERGDRERTW